MMIKGRVSMAIGSAALLVVTASSAVPFNTFDPKSMAMGGAGVAVANPSTAPFYNPALLSVADKDDDFSLEIPVFGVRVFDPGDFVDAIDDFDDGVVDQLDLSIDNYNLAATSETTQNVIDRIDAVNAEVLTLSDKPFQFEGGLGMVLSVPGEKFGVAISASGSANFSGVLDYADAATVSNMTDDLAALNNMRTCLDTSTSQADVETCVGAQTFHYVDTDYGSDDFGKIVFNAGEDSTGASDVLSTVKVLGLVVSEVGVTLSRVMSMYGHEVAVGLTPKMLSVIIFDYEASADSAETDNFDGDDYSTDYSDFNLDVGIAMDYKNGWRSGVVIKNIISQDYAAMNTVNGVETATGTVVSIKPQMRMGISHVNSWSTVALDVDLTENEGLGLAGDDSRYIALGVEFNAFDWAQLRFGYRADTVNSDRNVMSAGFGVSPFGAHIDLGVAANEDELGASFQLGFRF